MIDRKRKTAGSIRAVVSVILKVIIVALAFTACASSNKPREGFIGYDELGYALVPENDFHTKLQYSYLMNSDLGSATEYAQGVEELSRPRPFKLDFSDNENIGDSIGYVLQYADNELFVDAVTVNLTEKFYDLYNLKLGQNLYWRAAENEEELSAAEVKHFKVASVGPRNLFVDGVTNVRDIGGYDSFLVKGGKIRQGLFYRGAQLDDVTEEGVKTLVDVLGVKREIDIRNGEDMISPFKDDDDSPVGYFGVEIRNNTEPRRFSGFEEEYKMIYSIIAEAKEYPVYLHCQAGADRTGLVVSMLLAVCGVGYEDIARDYMFTNFSTNGTRSLSAEYSFSKWWNELKKLKGKNHAEKAANWLRSKGVTDAQIQAIRKALIEGY